MKRFFRRYILVIMIFIICLPAYAKYSGGRGKPNDPYRIATAADLIALGNITADYNKHYILTNDIDLAGYVFDKAVIAPDINDIKSGFQGTPFTGVFDGNNHTISHLTVVGKDYLGMFGQLSGEVKDIGLVDVNIVGSGGIVGGLVGYIWGSVSKCYSTGRVSGKSGVGGLVGQNSGALSRCYSSGTVSGTGSAIGGLVGSNSETVIQCYSIGSVSGNNYVGGLVGDNGSDGSIAQCYSTGVVSGTMYVGGLVGYNSDFGHVYQCYSTGVVNGTSEVGGLVGYGGNLHVLHGVWDVETSGISEGPWAVGLNTAEMMDPYMLGLNGFAKDPNWVLNPHQDYPRLAWEGTPGQIIPEPNINWFKGKGTPDNSYRIDTADQLILLGKASILWDKYFILDTDIDLDPALPGGQIFTQAVITAFEGVFDGNEHTISHLTVKGGRYLGLFGYLGSEAEVKNLGIVSVSIDAAGDYIGGLAGSNSGKITKCYSTGLVSGTANIGGLVGHCCRKDSSPSYINDCYSTCIVKGTSIVGGLVGYNEWFGTVTRCYSTSVVSGNDSVGGLVGENGSTVTNCYSTGVVSGNLSIGGLVGNNDDCGTVIQCYSTGAVSGTMYVGGLVGTTNSESIVLQCYSTGAVDGNDSVGGLVGYISVYCRPKDPVTESFWDIETSCQTTSDGGVGKTTAEMKIKSTFTDANWDFLGETANGTDDIWWIREGLDYPYLWWQFYPVNGAKDVTRLVIMQWISSGPGLCHDVYFGDDKTAVANATTETQEIYRGRMSIEKNTYNPGILEWGKTYFWRIDEVNETDLNSLWKGDIWTFTTTYLVNSPEPADGTDEVLRLPILSWLPAEPNIQYDVYFGDDEQIIANATPQTPGVYFGRQSSELTIFNPGILESNKTYYWRIDGIEQDNLMNPWKGKVWSFTTCDLILIADVVDDFETGYDDSDAHAVWATWEDGWYQDASNPGNSTGSLVGNWDPPFLELTIVHSGYQSMPMYYYNDGNSPYTNGSSLYYSEVERTWETPQDWTIDEADTLTLYFCGESDNSQEPLYVGIEDNTGHIAFVIHSNSSAVLVTEWQKWHIDLDEVKSSDVDVSAVKKMYIGVGNRNNQQPGGTGKIYIDDIRLTKRAP